MKLVVLLAAKRAPFETGHDRVVAAMLEEVVLLEVATLVEDARGAELAFTEELVA